MQPSSVDGAAFTVLQLSHHHPLDPDGPAPLHDVHECTAGVKTSPGALDVRIMVDGLDDKGRLPMGDTRPNLPNPDTCGMPSLPRLSMRLPAGKFPTPSSSASASGRQVVAVVWQDNANRTFASGLETGLQNVQLPALSSLSQASLEDAPSCNVACDQSYHVSVG